MRKVKYSSLNKLTFVKPATGNLRVFHKTRSGVQAAQVKQIKYST